MPPSDPGAPAPRLVPAARADAIRRASRQWPDLVLTPTQLRALELIGSGTLHPLTGFMDAAAVRSVRQDGTLPDGTPWPAPVVLVPPQAPPPGTVLALRDPEGDLLAALRVAHVFDHAGGVAVAGQLEVVQLPAHHDLEGLRLTPSAFARAHGRPAVAVTDRPLEATQLTEAAGVHVLAVDGDPGAGRVATATLVRALRAAGAASVTVVPAPPEGPVAAWAPLLAGAYGSGHVELPPPTVDDETLRHRLAAGDVPGPPTFARPVTEALQQQFPPPGRVGFTVLFTGLSGSGKSTVAGALAARLRARGPRRVTLLDGDLVRTHLSSELGFSRAHRDVNVLRIGFVAGEVTRHGGVAICAPIAPYEATRRRVREMIEPLGRFVLVHVATPLAICEDRDRKGLYAKARAGLIPEFTGISDPYETPSDADVVIDTSEGAVGDAVRRVEAHLERLGLIGGPAG